MDIREHATKRKRLKPYMSSESDSEDDIPLRRLGAKGKHPATKTDDTEDPRPTKRKRCQDGAAAESSEALAYGTTGVKRKNQQGTKRITRAKMRKVQPIAPTLDQQGDEGNRNASTPQSQETANELKGKGEHNGSRSENAEALPKRGVQIVGSEDDELAHSASRKCAQQPAELGGGDIKDAGGSRETVPRAAKKRRKATAETGTTRRVAQESEISLGTSKSSSSHRQDPTVHKKKDGYVHNLHSNCMDHIP